MALYVRSVVVAEKTSAPTFARQLVLKQQEALGLSLPGLARNRWRIGEEESLPKRTPRVAAAARDRFRVVSGGGSPDFA